MPRQIVQPPTYVHRPTLGLNGLTLVPGSGSLASNISARRLARAQERQETPKGDESADDGAAAAEKAAAEKAAAEKAAAEKAAIAEADAARVAAEADAARQAEEAEAVNATAAAVEAVHEQVEQVAMGAEGGGAGDDAPHKRCNLSAVDASSTPAKRDAITKPGWGTPGSGTPPDSFAGRLSKRRQERSEQRASTTQLVGALSATSPDPAGLEPISE